MSTQDWTRENISSGSTWEPIIGYSRAVKFGPFIAVSGTTASSPDGFVGEGDPAAQTRQILSNIEAALKNAGATMADVVRTRIFLTDISQWEAVGRVHGDVFGAIRPATAMVQVAKLISPEIMVEIEADAIIRG